MSKPNYTKVEYLKAWSYHLKQLKRIEPSNPNDAATVEDMLIKLSVIIDREANVIFPEVTHDDNCTGQCLGYCEDSKSVPLYFDPKCPPVDDEPCLCIDCYGLHKQEHIEELQAEIDACAADCEPYGTNF